MNSEMIHTPHNRIQFRRCFRAKHAGRWRFNVKNVINHAEVIARIERQFAGKQLGFEGWFVDSVAPSYTTGTFTSSTPVVNGASQTGASLITSGWASGRALQPGRCP